MLKYDPLPSIQGSPDNSEISEGSESENFSRLDSQFLLDHQLVASTPTDNNNTLLKVPVHTSDISLHPFPSYLNQDNSAVDFMMAKNIQCSKFSGYAHENPEKFINEFQSYSTFLNLNSDDNRKIAAFHLHLQGPALVWFNSINDDSVQHDWSALLAAFKARFLLLDGQSPVMLLESEAFQKLALQPGQPIEDFHCRVVEKGQIIKKPEYEMLAKFISGLPEKLAFFVRAGSPTDMTAALTSAKIGETCGYRIHQTTAAPTTPPIVAAIHTQSQSDLKLEQLQSQVQQLTEKINQMSATSQMPVNIPQHQFVQDCPRQCYQCGGEGHLRRHCNWNRIRDPVPHISCQLCQQYGHSASECLILMQGNGQRTRGNTRATQQGNQVPTNRAHANPKGHTNATQQGNRFRPGNARQNSLGKQ